MLILIHDEPGAPKLPSVFVNGQPSKFNHDYLRLLWCAPVTIS